MQKLIVILFLTFVPIILSAKLQCKTDDDCKTCKNEDGVETLQGYCNVDSECTCASKCLKDCDEVYAAEVEKCATQDDGVQCTEDSGFKYAECYTKCDQI